MPWHPPEPVHPHDWRRRAEDLLAKGEGPDPPAVESARLVHELRVHQLELEMQNEALNEARLIAEAGWERFRELYEGSPAGLFSVDGRGALLEVNPVGAHLLGAGRELPPNPLFGQFLNGADRVRFADFLLRGLEGASNPPCELNLPGGRVCLRSAASADGRVLQMVAMELSGL
jgi:PAS domain-containing protein